jgi:hypothetical protein
MKPMNLLQNPVARGCCAALLGLTLPAVAVLAADTNTPSATAAAPATNAPAPAAAAPASPTNAPVAAPASQTNAPAPKATAPAPLTPEQMFEGGAKTYNNWIDMSAGGFISSGNKSQFQQQYQTPGGAFGGIEDFHYQADVAKGTTLTTDGQAIFDNDDYKLSLGVTKEKLGYARFSYSQYRSWSNGDGGFYPPTGMYYSRSGDALALDHGDLTFEAGLALDNVPKITFKYEHTYQEGDKGSTSWGYAQPVPGLTRGLSPSFYDINEHSDAVSIDVTHQIKATEVGGGLRYETTKMDDALKTDQFPGTASDQKITDRQGTKSESYDARAYTETWIKKNLLLSSGVAYADLNNDLSGSRIFGSSFDVGYVPNPLQNDFGYYNLQGGSQLHEYVMDLNLFYKPAENLSVVPSVRVMKEDVDSSISGIETLSVANNPLSAPFAASSDRSVIDVRPRLDLTYKGVTNWVFYARGDWTEGQGNLNAVGGLGPLGGIGTSPILQQTDDSRLFQKYSVGARWYPTRGVTLDGGGYYKRDHYDYNNNLDSTLNNSFDRYPAYLVMQDLDTYDGNVRLTLRPRRNITLISRYEYQYSTVNTRPDQISGLGEVESSTMTSHIIGQDVSWTPWSRLYLQTGFNYVLSETKTPASDVTQAILAAQNNYWTLNFTSGFVVDNKTDLKLSFFYYRADDYTDNSTVGVPYGAGAEEYGVTATLARRITDHIRVTLKYGFSQYNDSAFGGHQDFCAHFLYSSLQYRF